MAYKCENCGSTNIKVDYKVTYTSLPEQYGYCCQDCGEKGFVTRSEVDDLDIKINDYINDKISHIKGLSLSDDINIVNTPKKEDKGGGGLMGWVCPKCGRCYSPFTSMCPYCSNNGDLNWNGFKVTC